MNDITTRARARALLAAATPGPLSVYPLTRAGRGFGVGRETPPDHKEGICEDPFMLAEDAELFAFAVNNLGTLCAALEVAETERDALRAEVERLRARKAEVCDCVHATGMIGESFVDVDDDCPKCGGSGGVIVEGEK